MSPDRELRAARVGDLHEVADAEVVVEPLGVGAAEVDAAVDLELTTVTDVSVACWAVTVIGVSGLSRQPDPR